MSLPPFAFRFSTVASSASRRRWPPGTRMMTGTARYGGTQFHYIVHTQPCIHVLSVTQSKSKAWAWFVTVTLTWVWALLCFCCSWLQEEEEDEGGDDEDGDDDDEDMGEEVCPPGCDQALYEKVSRHLDYLGSQQH